MQTRIAPAYRETAEGQRAEAILRSCVHCGFCNANCPTYRLFGDELDGPRGRIYLIKQVFEGHEPGRSTQAHLDRCLTCRSCETTCPSGVPYAELLELGRREVDQRVARPAGERLLRRFLRRVLPEPRRLRRLLFVPSLFARWLPRRFRPLVASRPSLTETIRVWPEARHARRMIVIDGCVQAAVRADLNLLAARILDRLGISLVRVPGCCGAVSQHLGAEADALERMRHNLDAWRHLVGDDIEAVLTTSSACSLMLTEYSRLLPGEVLPFPARDIAEVLAGEDLGRLVTGSGPRARVCFHPPCTLQHGLRLDGVVEGLLERLGFRLQAFADPGICCGSAGTYSLFEAATSQRLRTDKLAALTAPDPEIIATANIGCLLHLEAAADRPLVHWLELVAEAVLGDGSTGSPVLGSARECR